MSKAIHELDRVTELGNNDLLVIDKNTDSEYSTKSITKSDLESSLVRIVSSQTTGNSIATINGIVIKTGNINKTGSADNTTDKLYIIGATDQISSTTTYSNKDFYIENNELNFLGGISSGPLKFSFSGTENKLNIQCTSDCSFIRICSSDDVKKGATILLKNNRDYSSYTNNYFKISTGSTDGKTTGYGLFGYHDGRLIWGTSISSGKNIVREVQVNDTTITTTDGGVANLGSLVSSIKINGTAQSITNGSVNLIVDSTLSSTSTNPVQNKIINTALNNKMALNPIGIDFAGSTYPHGGYLDFHFAASTDDYTSRIIESSEGILTILSYIGNKKDGGTLRTSKDPSTDSDLTRKAYVDSRIAAATDASSSLGTRVTNLESGRVLRAGDTMSGPLKFGSTPEIGNATILRTSNNSGIWICGGTNNSYGGSIFLGGSEVTDANYKDTFILRTSSNIQFKGTNDGTLTWNSKNIVTSINVDGITRDATPNGVATANKYAECSTASSVAAKEVPKIGFGLEKGSRITVKFTNANTANNPTLNVNSTGAIYIYNNEIKITTSNSKYLLKGICEFVYDGANWRLISNDQCINALRFPSYKSSDVINVKDLYPNVLEYTAPSDGYFYIRSSGDYKWKHHYTINDIEVWAHFSNQTNEGMGSGLIPMQKGQTIKLVNDWDENQTFSYEAVVQFIPCI